MTIPDLATDHPDIRTGSQQQHQHHDCSTSIGLNAGVSRTSGSFMALRRLFKEQQKLWPITQQFRWASTAPSIYDRMVQITVVDVYGQRHVLRALTGHTLVDVLTEHQELLGSEEVTESPEGRGAIECVVSVPNEFLTQIPQTKDYLQQLRQITPSVTSNCRLGSKIILTKEMNDMQVALHEVYPWRTI